MMGSFRDEEYRFFDAHEGMASASDCLMSSDSSFGVDNGVSTSFEYQAWTKIPQSVQERRSKFLNWMGGLNSDQMVSENQVVECSDLREEEIDRITKDSGAVLRTSSFEDEFTSSRSSMSSWANDVFDVPEECGSNVCRIGNLGSGTVCSVDELGKKGEQPKLQVLGVDQLVLPEGFENNFDSSPAVQQSMRRETEVASNLVGTKNRVKNKWLSRLRSMTRIGDRQGGANNLRPTHPNPVRRARVQRVKVRHCRKRWKELSALFIGQDIQAHKGSIFTMKFSFDGQFLASAGEDCIVRVWQVKSSKLKNLRKTEDSACVIFPPRVFRILEEPLHQFHGHNGEILDLSWSENNFLLSSSVDTTVRLWQVGCGDCIKVFQHNNYVTCVQFNPLNSNHFISGSIDGKVRIWEVTGCQVVDWTDVKDIVTAVCYRPDGQGVVVGFMTGTCRFYDISVRNSRLWYEEFPSSNFSASAGHMITSNWKLRYVYTFFPQDPSKLMVTCADSQVRILHGINVVGKYKDGKHIVSTCDDSNVYLWNCINQEEHSLSQPKIIRSWERFSTNALIAIPWSGLKSENSGNGWQLPALDESSLNALPLPSPTRFFLDQEFILESFPKGSATWPEEKLLSSSPRAVKTALHKSQYKFLKSSCKSTSSSHAWDLDFRFSNGPALMLGHDRWQQFPCTIIWPFGSFDGGSATQLGLC
ncbi:hypothetical protein CsSME_00002021 [Camellia sinensis var. sinensis]